MMYAPPVLDPLDLEIDPGRRVRDLTTAEECLSATMALDLQMDSIMAQISRAEADPDGVEPGWRTRAQSAMRWKKRVKKAVIARQLALAPPPADIDQRRIAILQTIRAEVGEAEFERFVALAKDQRPDLGWSAS